MERWRKSLALKNESRGTVASSKATRHNPREERTMLLQMRRQVNGESSNRGNIWKPKVPSARKSIPRRLSYSRHDDSISLMNIGNNLDDTLKSTPMKLGTVPVVKMSNFDIPKKKGDDEELGLKKETFEFLKSIGVIKSPNSQRKVEKTTVSTKSSSSTQKCKRLSSARKRDQTNVDNSKENFCQSNEAKEHIQNVNELQNDFNLASLQLKVKEVLMKQTKEKSELREKHETEIQNLEIRHTEELIALFNPSAKETPFELPTVTTNNISKAANHTSECDSSPSLNLSDDSFLKSPFSGTWKVTDRNDNEDAFPDDPPTLGFCSTSNMTINGQQILDTPATRRLVTQRITQGIETLFFG